MEFAEINRTMKTPTKNNCLPRSFYDRPTDKVAIELLGKCLLRRHGESGRWIGGRIVETEAYLSSNDLASHSRRGMTKSNASMFANRGPCMSIPFTAKFV